MAAPGFGIDSRRRTIYGAAEVLDAAVPLVPVLVVAFALAPAASGLLAALSVGGVALVAAGFGLYRRSLGKWGEYHRT